MKYLFIIPARGGSKGVKGKNYKNLCGKPLICYTIEAAKKSNLSKIIVSSDSKKIIDISNRYGVETPFVRPSELSSDSASSIDVVLHSLTTVEGMDGVNYDAVMMLQPTSPFRRAEDINNSIDLLENNNVDSVISVVNVGGNHPARTKFIKNNLLYDPPFSEEYENQNRQELENMFIRNGAIYLTKRDTILNRSFKGKKCRALVMPELLSVNIDSNLDFDFAEWLLKNRNLIVSILVSQNFQFMKVNILI